MATVATEPSPRARCSAEADVQFLQECLAKFVGSRGSRDVLNLLKDTCSHSGMHVVVDSKSPGCLCTFAS